MQLTRDYLEQVERLQNEINTASLALDFLSSELNIMAVRAIIEAGPSELKVENYSQEVQVYLLDNFDRLHNELLEEQRLILADRRRQLEIMVQNPQFEQNAPKPNYNKQNIPRGN
jgi:hypothetical protein